MVTDGGKSSSVIVRTPNPSLIVTFDGLFRDTETVSLSSSLLSASAAIGMIWVVMPGAKVIVPLAAV